MVHRRKKPISKSPYVYGMGLLARREYSRERLRYKMIERGYSDDEAVLALDELATEGWLDDYRYGASLCRNLVERGYGPLYIQHAWRQKGVSPSCEPRELLTDSQKKALAECVDQSASCVPKGYLGAPEAASLEVLLAEYDDVFWCAQAQALIHKFTQTRWQACPSESAKLWRRAATLLQRRGYSNQCIRAVLGSSPPAV